MQSNKYPHNYLLMVKTIIRCMQLRSIPMGLATVLMGTACANLTGNLEIFSALLCLLFAPFAQICANLYHAYCDEKYHYGENIDLGIANMNYQGLTLERLLKEAFIGIGIITLTIGLALVNLAPRMGTYFGVLLILAIYLNNSGPYPLTKTPWKVAVAFLFFGPLGTIATAYVQAVHSSLPPPGMVHDLVPALYGGIIMGLFAVNSMLFYEYRTYEQSLSNARNTFCVYFGQKFTRSVYLVDSILIFVLSLFIGIFYHFHHLVFAMIVPTLCTVYNIWLGYKVKKEWDHESILWETLINWNMFFFALAIFIEFCFFGLPEDSLFTYFS